MLSVTFTNSLSSHLLLCSHCQLSNKRRKRACKNISKKKKKNIPDYYRVRIKDQKLQGKKNNKFFWIVLRGLITRCSHCVQNKHPITKNEVIFNAAMQTGFLSSLVRVRVLVWSRWSVLWGAAECRWSVAWAWGSRYCNRSGGWAPPISGSCCLRHPRVPPRLPTAASLAAWGLGLWLPPAGPSREPGKRADLSPGRVKIYWLLVFWLKKKDAECR